MNHSGTQKQGASCRGSKPWSRKTGERQSWGSGREAQGTEGVTPTAMLVGGALPDIPPVNPKWFRLPPLPVGVRLSAHAQAAVEYGVVDFSLAVERYKAFQCAACGKPRADCLRQAECTGRSLGKLNDIVARSKWLWISA